MIEEKSVVINTYDEAGRRVDSSIVPLGFALKKAREIFEQSPTIQKLELLIHSGARVTRTKEQFDQE